MDDKIQIKLLNDAITAYENGEILEAKDMAIDFINNITDFEAESEGSMRTYGKWRQEEILAAVEKMKEQFLQNADYLFCNPADYAELKNLMGDILKVKIHPGLEPGKICLVDRSATEGWRWFSEYEGEAPADAGTNKED